MSIRSPFSSIPGFSKNAILQLVIANGVLFVAYHIIRIVLLVMFQKEGSALFQAQVVQHVALSDVHNWPGNIYTALSYGWFHDGFWQLLSDMLWLYLFGSVIQMLLGERHVIPIFIYSMVLGGLFYYLGQLVNIPILWGRPLVITCLGSLVGMAVAALSLSPGYRIYFTERFGIALYWVVAIYGILVFIPVFAFPLLIFMVAGGALAGFGYIRLLNAGYNTGAWMFTLKDKLEDWVTPKPDAERKKHAAKRAAVYKSLKGGKSNIDQNRIDAILDKINQQGYQSLTTEEKETLMKASK